MSDEIDEVNGDDMDVFPTAPDPEVEALVADIAGEFRCDACDYLTYDERLVRRAVEAGRAPLLARVADLAEALRLVKEQRDDQVARRREAQRALAGAKAEGYQKGLKDRDSILIQAFMDEGAREEREECAALAEQWRADGDGSQSAVQHFIAADIRARGGSR